MKKQDEIRKIRQKQMQLVEEMIDQCEELGQKQGFVPLEHVTSIANYLYSNTSDWKLFSKKTVWQAVKQHIQQVQEYPEFVHTNGVNVQEATQAVYQRIFGPAGNYERYTHALSILKNKATTYYALIKAPNHPICREIIEENCLEISGKEMSSQTYHRLIYPFLTTIQKGNQIKEAASTMEGYRHPVLEPSQDYQGDVLSFNPDISQKNCVSIFLLDDTSIDITPFKKKVLQDQDPFLNQTAAKRKKSVK